MEEVEELASRAADYLPQQLAIHNGIPQSLAVYVSSLSWICMQLLRTAEKMSFQDAAVLSGIGFFHTWMVKKCMVPDAGLQTKRRTLAAGQRLLKPVYAAHNDAIEKALIWFAIASRYRFVEGVTRSAAIHGDIMEEHLQSELRRRCGRDDRADVVKEALAKVLLDQTMRAEHGVEPGLGSSSNRLGRGEPHLFPCDGEDAPSAGQLFEIVVLYIRIFNLYIPPEVEDELRGYGVWSDHPQLRLLPDLIDWRPSHGGLITTTQELITFTRGGNQMHRYAAAHQANHAGTG
jgi:hypothetical protein